MSYFIVFMFGSIFGWASKVCRRDHVKHYCPDEAAATGEDWK